MNAIGLIFNKGKPFQNKKKDISYLDADECEFEKNYLVERETINES